jgi:hypothetical protein
MIDREAAITVARNIARAQGWAVLEPIEALLRRDWFGRPKRWEIRTNIRAKGGPMARFAVDAVDGHVIDKGYIPL